MGAIEIQVFVSLVVILGAAFVALICDFLKGSNEQLREANIVMRVREDERDKRDDLVEKVQQQTIEVVAKVQGALIGRPAAAPLPAVQTAARVQPPPVAQPAPLNTPVSDAREPFDRTQSERAARGRRGNRRAEEKAPAAPQPESVASWAQDIVIRKHQEAEPAKFAEPVKRAEPVKQAVPAESLAVESVPSEAAQVPMPAIPAAMQTAARAAEPQFASLPEEAKAPTPDLAHREMTVPMAATAALPLAPVTASSAPSVPTYTNLTTQDDRDVAASSAPTKQGAEYAPCLVEAQQALAVSPAIIPVALHSVSTQPEQTEGEALLPAVARTAAACQLSEAGVLSGPASQPAAVAAAPFSEAVSGWTSETESGLPALELRAEVPEFQIVIPAVGPAISEAATAEAAPVMVAEAAEIEAIEAPVAEVAVVEEEPVLVAETAEVANVEAPVAEAVPMEATPELLAEEAVAPAASIEESPAELPVAEIPALVADYSLLEDTPVYADIPTVARVEPEPAPVAATEPEPVSLFAPELVEAAPEEEIQVVRIRVLSDDDVLPDSEFTDTFVSLREYAAQSFTTLEPEPVADPEPVVAETTADVQIESAALLETVLAEGVAQVQAEAVAEPEPAVEALEPAVAAIPAQVQSEPSAQPEPVAAEAALSFASAPTFTSFMDTETAVAEASSEPSIWLAGADPSTWALPEQPAVVETSDVEPEPIVAELTAVETEPVFAESSQFSLAATDDPFSYRPVEPGPMAETQEPAIPRSEMRPKVVEMRSAAPVRSEPESPAAPSLQLPGGFHEPNALARLLEDESPFSGLVIAVSVVDYVRLMADQGKPAIEQIMASVTRLVMSLTREQDFACRIAEDEFILIFGRETGAAAKRRIQLVSERLWDYQLRSLGSVSIIFSWGASESQLQPVVHAVENAREQMLETRRNRRNLTGVSRRFGRQVANS